MEKWEGDEGGRRGRSGREKKREEIEERAREEGDGEKRPLGRGKGKIDGWGGDGGG